jgi:PAS domain S-box-containing protein
MSIRAYLKAWRSRRRGNTTGSGGRTRHRFLSLQARITLGVAVATTGMLGAFSYIASWAIEQSTSTVLRDRQQVAEILAARIAESLSGYRQELEDLAWQLSRTPRSQQTSALREAGEARRFSGLALLTPAGAVAWSHPVSLARDASSVFPALLAASPNRPVVLAPVAGLPGASLVAFVVPIPGEDRVLVGAVDLVHAGSLNFLHSNDGGPLDVELVDGRGMVLVSSDPIEIGRLTEHMPVLARLIGQDRTGIMLHNVPSHPHYVAYTPLPGYPAWGVNVEQPRDIVLSLPHGLQRHMVLLGLVIVTGMSLLLAFLDVRNVTRPLSRLRDAAEKIAGGNLDSMVQVDRKDEVGALARTFETMRTKLKTSREEIAAWNHQLEDRVTDRTRELTAMAAENARLFALAKREERNLASTVDLLSDGLLTVDLHQRVLSLNPAAERLLGWTSEEARGLLCTEFFACSGCLTGHADAPCPIGMALEAGGTAQGVRIQARRRAGEAFPALVTTGLGKDETGHPTHFIVTLSDMTTEEAYERQLQGRIRQLTTLNEIARALSLLPLRTVEETCQEVVQRIAAVIGSGCRFDLDASPSRSTQVTASAPGGHGDSGEAHRSPETGGDPPGVVAEPVILKGHRIGTLWLAPGPAELTGEDPTFKIIASQVAVAVENAELYEEVQNRGALRRQLLQRIVVAQEEERHRIARELHDEVGQGLTALVMQLGAVETALPSGASELREQLAGIRSLTSQTVGEVRRLMLDLRPAVLDDLGLVPAIRWYVESHISPTGIGATVSISGLDEQQRLPRRVELVAFRLTQEAVTNVLRHAKATRITVALERRGEMLEVSIIDDGCGFDTGARRRLGLRSGWGLVGMQERVSLLGGSLTVASEAGRGTRVTATIPVGEDPDGDPNLDRR